MIYSNNDKAYIFVSSLELTYKKQQEIFANLKNPSDIFENYTQLKDVLGEHFSKFENALEHFSFATLFSYFEQNNIVCLTKNNENYPQNLLELDQPPFVLYCKGDINLLKTKCFAVVGTRAPSFYGKEITEKFTKGLCENGLTIVSGMAVGVDKIAHETTLKNLGKTIAVLGSGFEYMYPSLNINLSKEIEKFGLLVTEYYPKVEPNVYTFPARNRIIAGLSCGVLITEAGEKSGALHTKEFALEIGRNVYAIPGNITSSKSVGTNQIIKSGQCACVTSYQDILIDLGIAVKQLKKVVLQLSMEEDSILNELKDGEKSFDFLQEKTKLETKTLNTYLTTMQIRGIIKKLPGNSYMGVNL